MKYILFKSDGEFEETNKLDDPVRLDDYLIWNSNVQGPKWYSVQIKPGGNDLMWSSVDIDDVPKGLRLMALLII